MELLKNFIKNFNRLSLSFVRLKFLFYKRTYKKLTKKYKKEAVVLLFPFTWTGDAFYIFSKLDAFIKVNEIKDFAIFVINRKISEIAQLFGFNSEIITSNQMKIMVRLSVVLDDENRIKLMHHDPKFVLCNNVNPLCALADISLGRVIDACVFNDIEYANSLPIIGEYDDDIFLKNGLYIGRTVVLAPTAYTLPSVPNCFWIELAEALQTAGFTVCCNVAQGERGIDGIAAINLNYHELIWFVEKAGFFIGNRSGVCDVLAFCTARKFVIYSKNCTEQQINFFGLSQMWKNSNYIEIIHSEPNEVNINFILNKLLMGESKQ